MLNENVKWYALAIRSRCEKKSYDELQNKSVEVLLPLIEEVHRWKDRRKIILEPVFRGYLFVKTDLRDRIRILQSAGVIRFVALGNHISAIPDSQIEFVKIASAKPELVHIEPYTSVGVRVKVTSGPFRGLEGIIQQSSGKTRVVLSVQCIARSMSVGVPKDAVDKC